MMKKIIYLILLVLVVLYIYFPTNSQAYKDGVWWAQEVFKMEENPIYDCGVSKQYMRIKYLTDDIKYNCKYTPNSLDFLRGFKDFTLIQTKHLTALFDQLDRMKTQQKRE